MIFRRTSAIRGAGPKGEWFCPFANLSLRPVPPISNAGAIGVAVGLGAANIAIVLSLTNLLGLWLLSTLGVDGREDNNGNSP